VSSSAAIRRIDPRGHRFGGGLSAVLLLIAVVANAPVIVVAIAIALGASAFFGTQYSALGRPWPLVRRALRLGPPAELEAEFPPRFAQALGTIGLTVGLALLAAGATIAGWVAVLAVAALQTLLAVTGYCLGCRLYFLRWFLPALFDRLVRPGAAGRPAFGSAAESGRR
jgi:hypothetical protein